MIWQDAGGDGTELEVRECPDGHAQLVAARDAHDDDPVRVCLAHGFAGAVARRLCEATRPAGPMVLARPGVDTSRPLELHGVTLSAEPDRVVRIALAGGTAFRELPPSAFRHLCAIGVVFADAVESEPDPAEVEMLANLIGEERGLAGSVELARKILRAGYQREGGDRG